MLPSITLKPPAGAGLRHDARRLVLGAAWRACAGAVARVAAFHRRRRQIHRTVTALSQLSDHLLKDVGIHRSQIRSIAHSGRDFPRDRL
jgi:uncharacterized protein YjiS (DUF1127 family)